MLQSRQCRSIQSTTLWRLVQGSKILDWYIKKDVAICLKYKERNTSATGSDKGEHITILRFAFLSFELNEMQLYVLGQMVSFVFDRVLALERFV